MDHLDQGNREIHEEVTTLQESLERLIAMMGAPATAHNQPYPPPQTLLQRIMFYEITYMPVSVTPVSAP